MHPTYMASNNSDNCHKSKQGQAPSKLATCGSPSVCTAVWHFQWGVCTFLVEQEKAWACAWFQLIMWTVSVEHMHAFSWACACIQLSMCMLSIELVYACSYKFVCVQYLYDSLLLSVCTAAFSLEHMHTFSGAYGCFHLSMCTLSVEHICTLQLRICTLSVEHMCTLSIEFVEHVHAFNCACACFQFSICTLLVDLAYTFNWACVCLQLSPWRRCFSVEPLCSFFNFCHTYTK